MDRPVPTLMYVVGFGFVVIGIVALVFARPLGRFNEFIAERFLPDFLKDVVMEAPFGLDMRRRNILGGVHFIAFGLLYLWVVAELS